MPANSSNQSDSASHGSLSDTQSYSSEEIAKAIDVSDSVVTEWAKQLPEPRTPAFRSLRMLTVACLCGMLPLILVGISFFAKRDSDGTAATTNPGPDTEAVAEEPPTDSDSEQQPRIAPLAQGIDLLIYQADRSLEQLDTFRPTMQLLGMSQMVDSLDLTLNLLLDRFGRGENEAGADSDSESAPESAGQ